MHSSLVSDMAIAKVSFCGFLRSFFWSFLKYAQTRYLAERCSSFHMVMTHEVYMCYLIFIPQENRRLQYSSLRILVNSQKQHMNADLFLLDLISNNQQGVNNCDIFQGEDIMCSAQYFFSEELYYFKIILLTLCSFCIKSPVFSILQPSLLIIVKGMTEVSWRAL